MSTASEREHGIGQGILGKSANINKCHQMSMLMVNIGQPFVQPQRTVQLFESVWAHRLSSPNSETPRQCDLRKRKDRIAKARAPEILAMHSHLPLSWCCLSWYQDGSSFFDLLGCAVARYAAPCSPVTVTLCFFTQVLSESVNQKKGCVQICRLSLAVALCYIQRRFG